MPSWPLSETMTGAVVPLCVGHAIDVANPGSVAHIRAIDVCANDSHIVGSHDVAAGASGQGRVAAAGGVAKEVLPHRWPCFAYPRCC